MDWTLPDEIEMLRDATRKFVEKELAPIETRIEETQKVPEGVLKMLREMGYFGITIPKDYGGLGLGLLAWLIVQEELAKTHSCFNMILSGNNGIGSLSIINDGNEQQKRRYLPPLAAGEVISAFALTEPGAGSDAAAITTRAEKRGAGYVLNGMKHFISRADIAGVFTVLAVTDPQKGTKGGITAFIVEKGTPGFSLGRIQKTMGSDVPAMGELVFEDCTVPEDNVIGRAGEGFKVAMKTLEEGRLSIAARSLGTAERLLALSTAYAKQRVQFGRPIGDNQAIQWMLADMAADIALLRPLLYQTARKRELGVKVTRETSIAKLFGTEMLCRAADKAIQIHGGMGYMKEFPLERIYRDARGYRIFEGTSEIQRLIIARDLLS